MLYKYWDQVKHCRGRIQGMGCTYEGIETSQLWTNIVQEFGASYIWKNYPLEVLQCFKHSDRVPPELWLFIHQDFPLQIPPANAPERP